MRRDVLVTPSQIRGARALLDWSQQQLAEAAGMSLSTIRDYEKERRGWRDDENGSTDQVMGGLGVIRRTLENKGVRFLSSEGDYGPGVRMIAKVPSTTKSSRAGVAGSIPFSSARSTRKP